MDRENKIWVLSYIEGLFFALMVGSSESYFLYFQAKHGVTGSELGLLSTLPIFLASCSLILMPKLFPKASLTKSMLMGYVVQIFGLSLFVFSALSTLDFWVSLCGLSLYWIGGQNSAPLWLDFMSHHSKRSTFGSRLAKRNSFVLMMTMIFYLSFSYLVRGKLGFHFLFSLGLGARILSFIIIYLQVRSYKTDLRFKQEMFSDSEFEIKAVLKRFLAFGTFFRFAVAISAPYFVVYMINDLKLSIPSYVWLTASVFIGRAIFQKNWVLASEKGSAFYGVQLSTFFISFLPLLWTFSSNYSYLVVLQVGSGIFWGGIELTQILMIQYYLKGQTRSYIGIQQALFGFAATAGALFGGFLYDHGHSIKELFEISTAARLIVAIGLVSQLRNFKLTRLGLKNSSNYLVTLISIRPSIGLIMRTITYSKRKTDLKSADVTTSTLVK